MLISSAAAGLLDKTVKTTAVKAGLLVGVATIVVNTKQYPRRDPRSARNR